MIGSRYKVNKINENCKGRVECIYSWFAAFLVFCSCGFAGSIIDADHFVKVFQTGAIITQQTVGGREYHILYFLAFCFILLSCTSLIYRLYTLVVEGDEI